MCETISRGDKRGNMDKAELKNFLLIYDKIKDAIETGKEYAYIRRCNRKQKIMFPEC